MTSEIVEKPKPNQLLIKPEKHKAKTVKTN